MQNNILQISIKKNAHSIDESSRYELSARISLANHQVNINSNSFNQYALIDLAEQKLKEQLTRFKSKSTLRSLSSRFFRRHNKKELDA